MIVPSMTNLEVYNELAADLPKLKIRANSLMPKVVKGFRKERKFPAWKWEEYTHQESHNRYQICFYAPTMAHADNPDVTYLAFLEDDHQRFVIEWGHWVYHKQGSKEVLPARHIGYFSGHFFSRYRERIWKNKDISYNEILCRYFSRNILKIPLEINEDIQHNNKEYGELAQYAFKVSDGTCFIRSWSEGDESTIGQKDSNFVSVVFYLTFVNKEMMSETQINAIKKEGTKFITNYYKNLFKDAMKESLFYRLNTVFNKHMK